jgi:hypothetical protein
MRWDLFPHSTMQGEREARKTGEHEDWKLKTGKQIEIISPY